MVVVCCGALVWGGWKFTAAHRGRQFQAKGVCQSREWEQNAAGARTPDWKWQARRLQIGRPRAHALQATVET